MVTAKVLPKIFLHLAIGQICGEEALQDVPGSGILQGHAGGLGEGFVLYHYHLFLIALF
jgi:hypothetical protein